LKNKWFKSSTSAPHWQDGLDRILTILIIVKKGCWFNTIFSLRGPSDGEIFDPLAFCVTHLCLFIECYYGLRGGGRIKVCKYVIYTSDLIKTATIQM
jgi:hypothetical protein